MKSGATIGNRNTGETLTMLKGEDETGGMVQCYRVHLPPHRQSPPLHYHLAFTERFTCLHGTLDVYLGRERRHVQLHSGQSVTAELGQPHTFANTFSQPCDMTVETRPAGGVVKAFQLAYGLANDGRSAPDGLPLNPLLRLRFIAISQGFVPQVPRFLQKAIFRAAFFLSRLTGTERIVERCLHGSPAAGMQGSLTTDC